MNRRVFVSTLLWGAVTFVVRPVGAMPPPFDLVRKRVSERSSGRPAAEVSITSMGESIASWQGKLSKGSKSLSGFENEKHGKLRLGESETKPSSPGFELLAALLSPDPLAEIEKTFGGIRHAKNRVESHQERSLAYRFGESPSILVERETWTLLEVDLGEHEGHRWIAHLSYRPEQEHAYMIRITKDKRPAITARLEY